jgi:hypothetical protein
VKTKLRSEMVVRICVNLLQALKIILRINEI